MIRPYLSIDLETTGLDTSRAHILEIGAVLDDGGPLDQLETYSAIVNHDSFSYATPYAMNLNQGLLKAILAKEGVRAETAFKGFVQLLVKAADMAYAWDERYGKKPSKRVSIAGKNAAGFDIPIMETQFALISSYLSEGLSLHKNHRVIDVGSMYYKQFGYVPMLEEIKKKIGIGNEVSHRALDDAMDVVKAIRAA